jgi:hypothetical protein
LSVAALCISFVFVAMKQQARIRLYLKLGKMAVKHMKCLNQEVGYHQLLQIQQQLQNFVNWWPETQMTLNLVEDSLHSNNVMICQILHENLAKSRLCALFVPHGLTEKQK